MALASIAIAGCEPPPAPAPTVEISTKPPAVASGTRAEYAKDSILVRFRATPGAQFAHQIAAQVNGSIEDRNHDGIDDGFAHLANGQLALVRLAGQSDVDLALVAVRSDPAVLYAEPNYILRAVAAPNDPRLPELYGLHNTGQTGGTPDADIDALEAWNTTVGSSDVVVGVIDTGVDYRHEDLAANIWINPNETPNNGIDDDGNGVIDDVHGFNAIDGSGDPFDDNYHGTHTAGTIGAVGGNGIGVTGVNWDVQLMALKFLNYDGWGTTADAIRAIDYAVAQKLAGVNLRVLSNSWGGAEYSQALVDAIVAAGEVDILFVAAAGNSSVDSDEVPYYPSCYDAPNLVSVAATDHSDALAWFSNFGATSVDIGAPGESILSTTPNGEYQFLDGTSMATPHVAGVAALVLSVNSTLTVDELKDLLLRSGDPIAALDGITVTGRRLNAASAVAQAGPAAPRFTMGVTPSRKVIAQEDQATYSIDVRSMLGFAGDVALTVSAESTLDAAIAITPVVTAPGRGTLTITTSAATALGAYKLTVTGTSGPLVVTRTIALRIVPRGTRFEVNLTPPHLTTPQEGGASFLIAVDGVGDFSGEVGLSLSSQPPFPGTVYITRGAISVPGAAMLNVYTSCTTPPGDYVFTITATAEGTTAHATATLTLDPFGTVSLPFPSSDTPIAIPDRNAAGIASAIEIGADLAIDELSVTVNITHTRIGDLVVQLAGPDGTRVTLHDRTGGDDDDLRRTYTVGALAGRTSAGVWRLLVSDRVTRQTGRLDSWELNVTGIPRSFPPMANFDFFVDGLKVEFYDNSFGTACGGGPPIVSRLWDLGDGTTSTEQSLQHTYAAPGDYLVTLTITDRAGLSSSIQQTVTAVRPPRLSIERISRDRTRQQFSVDLRWRDAAGSVVDLYRNAAQVGLVWNDGYHRDTFRGQETAYRWYICERPGLCSNEVSIDFGPNVQDGMATVAMTIDGKQITETIAIEDEPAAGGPLR